MKLLVSACLLGIACKYSGGDNLRPELLEQLRRAGAHSDPRLSRDLRRAFHHRARLQNGGRTRLSPRQAPT